MTKQSFELAEAEAPIVYFGVTKRSNRLVNYFLAGYFLLGLVFATFYGTWLLAAGFGGFLLVAYYSFKFAHPDHCRYQYVLSIILGLYMAQFIYQMHGMIEMHFFVFIGSALLITFQNWKLQLPMLFIVLVHHILFSYLHNAGVSWAYFSEQAYINPPTFLIHILLAMMIFLISGLCAYQLHQYHQLQLQQAEQLDVMQENAKLSIVRQKNTEAMEERNVILESIGDAFFAVDKNWAVTYWNKTAEKVLFKSKKEMLSQNLWDVFPESVDSKSYRQYHLAIRTNEAVHFEDYYEPLNRWYEISAYPSTAGLSVYFKDITDRKQINADLIESEKRYSDVFHLSPLPMWVVDLSSMKFMDVNQATVNHYGYSRDEFLTMTLKDIRPLGELSSMESILARAKSETKGIGRRQMIHCKKNGELMNMEIEFAPFRFKGMKTSIVIANDMTERLRYIKAIEQQNEKLQAISWMQSHVVRAPLARIMGLLPLFYDLQVRNKKDEEIIKYMIDSANELDEVIRNITDVTGIVPLH